MSNRFYPIPRPLTLITLTSGILFVLLFATITPTFASNWANFLRVLLPQPRPHPGGGKPEWRVVFSPGVFCTVPPAQSAIPSMGTTPLLSGGGRAKSVPNPILGMVCPPKETATFVPLVILSTTPSLMLNPSVPLMHRPDYLTVGLSGDPVEKGNRYDLTDSNNVIIPTTKPLQPGKTYAIRLFKQNGIQMTKAIEFKVMGDRDRQKINARLAQIDTQLAQERLQKRLEILAQEGLLSDILEEIQTSPALTAQEKQDLLQTTFLTWQTADMPSPK